MTCIWQQWFQYYLEIDGFMPTFEPSANCSIHWIAKRCCEKPRAVHKNKHTAPKFQNTPRHATHFDHRATSLWCVCVQRSAHKQRPKQMGYNFCPHSPLFGVCSHEFGQPRLVAIFRMLNTQMNYAAEYVCQVRGDGDVTVGWLAAGCCYWCKRGFECQASADRPII